MLKTKEEKYFLEKFGSYYEEMKTEHISFNEKDSDGNDIEFISSYQFMSEDEIVGYYIEFYGDVVLYGNPLTEWKKNLEMKQTVTDKDLEVTSTLEKLYSKIGDEKNVKK